MEVELVGDVPGGALKEVDHPESNQKILLEMSGKYCPGAAVNELAQTVELVKGEEAGEVKGAPPVHLATPVPVLVQPLPPVGLFVFNLTQMKLKIVALEVLLAEQAYDLNGPLPQPGLVGFLDPKSVIQLLFERFGIMIYIRQILFQEFVVQVPALVGVVHAALLHYKGSAVRPGIKLNKIKM